MASTTKIYSYFQRVSINKTRPESITARRIKHEADPVTKLLTYITLKRLSEIVLLFRSRNAFAYLLAVFFHIAMIKCLVTIMFILENQKFRVMEPERSYSHKAPN
jgi:hypothetical protein